jgi:hypothetical protein
MSTNQDIQLNNNLTTNFKRYELFHKLTDLMNEYNQLFNSDIQRDLPIYINEGFSGINLCLDCSIDMGDINPRQLCGKYKCHNNDIYNNLQ